MIEMRGCAFITMATRFNADRALRHMRNRRIEGCDVKVSVLLCFLYCSQV